MATADPDRQARRAQAEQSALDSLAERLANQFPDLSADQITRTIKNELDSFDNSSVRDFVPVLVERAVRATLSRSASDPL